MNNVMFQPWRLQAVVKTTVKEMVASILQQRGKVLFEAGNSPHDIGVPFNFTRDAVNQAMTMQ